MLPPRMHLIKTEKRCFYCEFEIYFYCSLDIWSSMLLLLCMQTNCRQQQINLCFFKDIIQSSPWQQFLFSYMHPKWHYLHDPIKMNTNALSTTMPINIICLNFKIKYKQYLAMCTISKHNITQWVKVNFLHTDYSCSNHCDMHDVTFIIDHELGHTWPHLVQFSPLDFAVCIPYMTVNFAHLANDTSQLTYRDCFIGLTL